MAVILIVDDDRSVLDTFRRMLDLEGHEVVTALDTEAALHELERAQPDAILLDLRMPVESGIAFLRRLRAQEGSRRTPVAIITGDYFARESLGEELRELQASVYYKPVWLADLIAIVQQLLEGS